MCDSKGEWGGEAGMVQGGKGSRETVSFEFILTLARSRSSSLAPEDQRGESE